MTYANQIDYTDIHPFEIVRTVSAKCVEVRSMDAEMDPTWKPDVIVGGFSGHTVNNHTQRWTITSNLSAPVRRIRQHKDGQWRDSHGNRYRLSAEPRRFYDFNF